MHIQKVNGINNSSYCKKNINNIKFGQNVNLSLKGQSTELVKKYLRNFKAERAQYSLEGNSILQPESIPESVLLKIAENALNKMNNFSKNRILYIVTGRIGGGKTSFVKQNNFQKLFYCPDADEIKPLLPKYKERGSSYVHKASYTINSTNISEALKRGIDTIIQTSTTIDNLDDIIDEARERGYKDIILIHIDTNEDIAIKRAEQRGMETGRTIDSSIIRERKYIDDIVTAYKNPLRGVSQLIVFDNNGIRPVKVEDLNLNPPEQNLSYVTECSD